MKLRIALAALAAVSAVAAAEPRLQLTHEPPPRHLRMRPRAAATPPPAPAPRAVPPVPAAPVPLSARDPSDRGDELAALRDVRAPVSFSLTVGYQVDAARPSGKPSLDGPVQAGRDYSALRSYGFGELFLSTRGVALDSLSSYFALRFDAARPARYQDADETARIAPPIATWFERNTFEVRTGWAELKDFLPRRLGLRKLRLRAGSQYVYGPWVLHLDGGLLAYDGDIVTATAYAGGRHADYTTNLASDRYAALGASLRIDLRTLVGAPLAITAETLSMTSYVDDQPSTAHRQLALDWQPRRDFTLTAQVRTLDDRIASERLQLRARYRQVTNLVFDLQRRLDTDWRWDPSLITADDPTTARRYLDLGPVLPQLIASLRGGTLIAENVDLFARFAVASALGERAAPRSSYAASYLEFAGALEVRPRRQVAIALSALTRQSSRDELEPIVDMPGVAQALPASAATGETSFTELGTRARLSLGARQFSATLELYGRRTRYADTYRDLADDIPRSDVRGGGRVSIDAWVGQRIRLAAAYDASSSLELQPQITLYKSLRLTMTGVY